MLRCSTISPTSARKCSNNSAHSANIIIIQRVLNAAVSTAQWVTSSVAMQRRCRPPCYAQSRNNKHPVYFFFSLVSLTEHFLCLSKVQHPLQDLFESSAIRLAPGAVRRLGHTCRPVGLTQSEQVTLTTTMFIKLALGSYTEFKSELCTLIFHCSDDLCCRLLDNDSQLWWVDTTRLEGTACIVCRQF